MDISQFLRTTSRSVRDDVRDGQPVKVLEVSRSYATTPERLWALFTSVDCLSAWFLPVSGELRVGGKFQFKDNAGGEILECEPNKRAYLTWEHFGQVSWVELLFSETEGGASLLLRHVASVPKEMWDKFGPGAVGIGWEMGFLGLEEKVSTDRDSDPDQGMAWMGSPTGIEFIEGSSAGWADASIAAGTPADEAKAAADGSSGFYKGIA